MSNFSSQIDSANFKVIKMYLNNYQGKFQVEDSIEQIVDRNITDFTSACERNSCDNFVKQTAIEISAEAKATKLESFRFCLYPWRSLEHFHHCLPQPQSSC